MMFCAFLLALAAIFVETSGSEYNIAGDSEVEAEYSVQSIKFIDIRSFDGTKLRADASLPVARSGTERFPVVILANSWGVPQVEYVVQAQRLASAGYVVLEYEARGWYLSGGKIDTAGPDDQRDVSEVISFVLNQTSWQPDASKIALVGISYGAGLALLGAGHDTRVTTVAALSGWTDIEKALFGNASPSLIWGDLLMLFGHVLGKPSPDLDNMYREMLQGNESAFRDWAFERSPIRFKSSLEARSVPLFLSNNLEDRLFHPQDALDFFQQYAGPKRLLLNQGIHASAELAGLAPLPFTHNHVWVEVKKWLDTWLKGESGPEPPLVEMQLRSNRAVREQFEAWPSDRVQARIYHAMPRGDSLHGSLSPGPGHFAEPPEFESISFARKTGIGAGMPVLGELLQVYIDRRIKANLLFSSRAHAVWYYIDLDTRVRLCGTPRVSLDISPSESHWQVVAYLFGVDRLTKEGTLISHGPLTCWNCTKGQRQTHSFELRSLCEELGGFGMGGLALALNLFVDLYEPANADKDLSVAFHYSDNFTLSIPVIEDSEMAIDI